MIQVSRVKRLSQWCWLAACIACGWLAWCAWSDHLAKQDLSISGSSLEELRQRNGERAVPSKGPSIDAQHLEDDSGVAAVLNQVAKRGAIAKPAAGKVESAQALAWRVKVDAAHVHQQMAGQRLNISGVIGQLEQGEAGVIMLTLRLEGQNQGLRLVMAPDVRLANGEIGQQVTLDCLSEGVMMGEWLLVDCRKVGLS